MNKDFHISTDYKYCDAKCNESHNYLLPQVKKILLKRNIKPGATIFDLGCGNGSVGAWLHKEMDLEVIGVDPSEEGISEAKKEYPELDYSTGSAYDDLSEKYGCFPVVISLEVVEHIYSPRKFASTLFDLVQKEGIAIVSTPYHGYLKNVVLALSGKMDDHFTALWDHGHIKFWSEKTLKILLEEQGFNDITFHRVGRIPWLAKSMIAVAQKEKI